MKKVRDAMSDKFHGGFGGAIAGLANSARIAVKRAALRNNTAEASVAAECLRASDDPRIEDQNRASLIPEIPMTEHDTWIRINDTDDAVGGTRAASDSFERAEGKHVERKDQSISELSPITQPILKLYDQLGGFTKR
jgi:hypothetical protein